MKLLNFSKLGDLASLAATSLSTLMLATSPALAWTFSFCGTFDSGAIPGGTVNGAITVNDQGSFADSANITTKDVNGGQVITYTQANFGSQTWPTTVSHPGKGIPSYSYSFNNSAANSVFKVYLPAAIFPIPPGTTPDLIPFNPFDQYETRNGIEGRDDDRLQVPEPLTTLGAVVVLGAIPTLKKEYAKSKKKKDGAEIL